MPDDSSGEIPVLLNSIQQSGTDRRAGFGHYTFFVRNGGNSNLFTNDKPLEKQPHYFRFQRLDRNAPFVRKPTVQPPQGSQNCEQPNGYIHRSKLAAVNRLL